MAEPARLADLLERAETVARDVLRPNVEEEDREGLWPDPGMRALAATGLMGLNAPIAVGGHGLGLEALVSVSRVLARENPSAALCYAMHCVGTAVIAAKATPVQEERFLRPIAAGDHITTLSLSKPGTGSHFYFPETRVQPDGDDLVIDGVKSFITNGGHADSYVMSTAAADGGDGDEGIFSAVLVEADAPGLVMRPPRTASRASWRPRLRRRRRRSTSRIAPCVSRAAWGIGKTAT